MPTPSTMNRLGVQAAIVAMIKGLDGVDPDTVFQDFQRAKDFSDLISKFKTADGRDMMFWRVRRVSYMPNTAESTNHAQGIPIRHDVWWDGKFEIEFHMGISEDNEERFQLIIDEFLTTAQPQRTWGEAVCNSVRPLGLDSITTGTLGGVVLTRQANFSVTISDHQHGIVPV